MRKALSNRPVHVDFGILLIRVGIGGLMFWLHGWDKLSSGTEMWSRVGGAMGNFGIHFAPTFWGFMAAFSESICAVLIALGLLFRPATLLLGFTMFVAGIVHLNMPPDSPRGGWTGASHAFELMIVCVGLFFAGAGRFSVKLERGEG